eukprot:364796-Chlamydomonas_euryale.AAC.2
MRTRARACFAHGLRRDRSHGHARAPVAWWADMGALHGWSAWMRCACMHACAGQWPQTWWVNQGPCIRLVGKNEKTKMATLKCAPSCRVEHDKERG